MPTHASLQHNMHIFKTCVKADHDMVAACFLTHFHVMGLICHYLFVPYCGGVGYFMSPAMFVNNPSLWIRALSKFKATFCMVPNFALDLATAASLPPNTDLSSLEFLSNGSESVSINTMERFHSKFTPHGLQKHTLCAFYGLSEHTVHLCASEGEEMVIVNGQVSNGRPDVSVTVKAVDPKTRMEVADGAEGEIWVQSASKARGYWGKEEVSKETFQAQLVGDNEKTYLRTGDMGFIHQGSVFILGRLKNLLVVRGKKIYLNDIENRVEALFIELRSGRTAAVEWESTLSLAPPVCPVVAGQAAPAPRKGVGLFAELQREDEVQPADCHALAERIASTIGVDFQVETLLIALIPLKAMPCTGSGKRQRPLCKKNLLNGTLPIVYQWTPLNVPNVPLTIRPEMIPLPPTPMAAEGKRTSVRSDTPPPKSKFIEVHPPCKVPSLKLDSPQEEKEMAKEVPRKESRFCLEGASPPLQAVKPSATVTQEKQVDRLTVPTSTRKQAGKKLMGQEKTVIDVISKVLGAEVRMDTNVWAHGCNSVKAIQISSQLEQHLGFSVEAHLLYAYQTPRALLEKLKRTLLQLCSPIDKYHSTMLRKGPPPSMSLPKDKWEDGIAIVSMACKFPDCDSPEELWQLLSEKHVAITHIQDPTTSKWIHGGFTSTMATFDHQWFGISQFEASTMDPQQSILLHTAWECLQRSGYRSPEEVRGSNTGVFVGFGGSDAHALGLAGDNLPPSTSYAGAIAANRISYAFDLKGPSVAIDTACASSLTALDVAFSFMHLGKCSQALVGGVNALLEPKMFWTLSNMGMLSPAGECCVFDSTASGYVRGEGCGMVMLKRLGDAIRDKNRILAVVRSVESCHNGKAATLTSPNKISQRSMLENSLTSAQIGPYDVSYMEAHGTGTPLGDPMEMDAIQAVLGRQSDKKMPRVGPLIVGSIKANIGHLEAGAGVAGLIKTVLILEHAKAPGNPLFETYNPALKVDTTQIQVPREMVNLDDHYMYRPENQNLLHAGVNSFGFGGVNTTAFLQQYSQLPHLAQVKCGLILGGESDSIATEEMMGIIQLLRARIKPFDVAYISCIEAFQRATKPIKMLTNEAYHHHPAFLMFCLLYSTVQALLAHDVEITFLMGTNLCAEVVCLALSDVLILSDAMRLLLVGMAPDLYNIKFIIEEEMQPNISFLSPTLNQLCLTGRFSPASLNQLIAELHRGQVMASTCSDSTAAMSLLSIAKSHEPLAGIMVEPDSLMMAAFKKCTSKASVIIQLQAPSLIEHLRESCLELRRASDRPTLESGRNPSTETTMPKFYERYPMRYLTDKPKGYSKRMIEEPQDSSRRMTEELRSHFPSNSDTRKPDIRKQRSSWADESGYLTQATSAESVQNTPAVSPIKAPPTTACPEPEGKQQVSEQSVVDSILDLIRREFFDITLPSEEAAETGLFVLGLDSLCLIEVQDYLLKTYEVDLPLARLTELATVKAIAAEVYRETSSKSSTVTKEEKRVDSNGSHQPMYPEYPIFTKEGYYSIPSMKMLQSLSAEELKRVPNFTVGRSGHGKIEFLGQTDVSNLNLDQLISIKPQSIQVHKSSTPNLNKAALVFFENVFQKEHLVDELLQSMSVPAVLVHSDSGAGLIVLKVNCFY